MSTPLKQKRRKQILDASLEVFIKEGFHSGTVEDIANRADLGKGTIYEYFSSKQNIFEQMILSNLTEYLELSKEITGKENTVRDKLIVLLQFNKTFLDKNMPLIEQSISGFQDTSEDFNYKLKNIHKSIFEFMINLVKIAKENKEISSKYEDKLIALIWINIIKGVNNSAKIFDVSEDINSEDIIDILYNSVK